MKLSELNVPVVINHLVATTELKCDQCNGTIIPTSTYAEGRAFFPGQLVSRIVTRICCLCLNPVED